MRKCDRCHGEFGLNQLSRITYFRKNKIIFLCKSCYGFMRQRFDDDIEEYILRKE